MNKEEKLMALGIWLTMAILLSSILGLFLWVYIDLGMPKLYPLSVESIVLIITLFLCIAFGYLVTYIFTQIYLAICSRIIYGKPKNSQEVNKHA